MYEMDVRTTLNDLEERYVHAMMRRVSEIAPYSSTSQVQIEELKGDQNDKEAEKNYRIHVEIRSPVGLFSGTGISDDLREAVDQAECRVQKEISDWRAKRFRDQAIDTYRSAA